MSKEYKKNQALRIKETHESYGIEFRKGQIVWTYKGETFGVEAEDEIAVMYSENQPFVCVKKELVEPYRGDPNKLFKRSLAHQRSATKLIKYQQRYRDMGMMEISDALRRLRRELYIEITTKEFGWDRSEAASQFDSDELSLKVQCLMPYEINTSDTVN